MIDADALVDNEFLRQFEYTYQNELATIEYALQNIFNEITYPRRN